jgi:hypothetical protein
MHRKRLEFYFIFYLARSIFFLLNSTFSNNINQIVAENSVKISLFAKKLTNTSKIIIGAIITTWNICLFVHCIMSVEKDEINILQ